MPASDALHPHRDTHPTWAQPSRSYTSPALCQNWPAEQGTSSSLVPDGEERGRRGWQWIAVAIFLTTAYNPGKQSTWEELSSLKVIGRADTWGGVAELWGHIRPPCAETGGKRQEAWTGKRNQVSK